MGFFDSITKFSATVISSPSALRGQQTSEILNTKSILNDILRANDPDSETYKSAEIGLDNVNRELNSRGIY